MTTKKAPAKKTTAKKATTKDTTAKKTTGKATAAAVAAPVETVKVTMAPEAPETEATTPVAAAPEAAAPAEKPVLTIGMFQKRLHERGYYHGWWDGHYGPMTKEAVARFQHANGLHPDGEPTPETLAKLGF